MKGLTIVGVLLTFSLLVTGKTESHKTTTVTPIPLPLSCAATDGAAAICETDSKEATYECECPVTGTSMVIDCAKETLVEARLCPDFGPSSQNITSIDVNLSGNRIKSLDNAMLSSFAPLVSNLDLGNNRIVTVDDNSFEKFNNLVILNLRGNGIAELRAEMFVGLEKLEQLDLSDNRISDVSGNVFKHLRNLRRLILDRNPLRSMDNKTFHLMSHLESLSMDNCSLESLTPSVFKGLHSLHRLSLANNKFLVIPDFRGLVSVRKLVLSGNEISEVDDGRFADLPHLTELRMTNMSKLWLLDSCAFCGLKSLQTLVIRDCPELTNMEELAFGRDFKLKGLAMVDLSNNKLTRLHEATLPWGNITELHLEGNNWACDCTMKWLPTISLKMTIPAHCSGPADLKGKSLAELNNSDFYCLTTQVKSRRLRGRMFAGMVALLSVAALTSLLWFLCYGKYDCRLPTPPWKSARGPIYAYRNLAMRTEDEATSCAATSKDEQPLVMPKTSDRSQPDPVAL